MAAWFCKVTALTVRPAASIISKLPVVAVPPATTLTLRSVLPLSSLRKRACRVAAKSVMVAETGAMLANDKTLPFNVMEKLLKSPTAAPAVANFTPVTTVLLGACAT